MLDFKPLTLSDIPAIRPYFDHTLNRACDNSVGGTFMWRSYFDAHYAVIGDSLVLRVRYIRGETAFAVPLTPDPYGDGMAECVSEIKKWCGENSLPCEFVMAAKEDVDALMPHVTIKQKTAETDWFDYLYHAEDLMTFKGRKFNGQRNHKNAFLRENPLWVYEPITERNIAEVREFYGTSEHIDAKSSPLFYEDQRAVFEVLDNFGLYGMNGGMVRCEPDGRIAAFSVGEVVGDTLFVHIEKADTELRGSYPMIVSEFAREMYGHHGGAVSFINREDDAGDLGLRTSKLAYHPCEIIEKFTLLCE